MWWIIGAIVLIVLAYVLIYFLCANSGFYSAIENRKDFEKWRDAVLEEWRRVHEK